MGRSVDIIIHAGLADPKRVQGTAVAVIDVFRATSVIVTALANGAASVIPFSAIEQCLALAGTLPRESVILGGERDALPIDGFDTGNSPGEYTSGRVSGKTVILSTTNGTRAIENASAADVLYISSMLNYAAVCGKLEQNERIILMCSGTDNEFTLEDGLCAGAMAGILKTNYGYALSDMAQAMEHMYRTSGGADRLLCGTRHYKRLVSCGFISDIEYCLRENIFTEVPYLADNKIII